MITASLPDVKQFLGLELGDAQLHVSRTILSDEVRRTTSASRIPPSILLPLDGAEPYRLDARWPAHPRGSGRNWPEEARFDIATGAGRLPAALAWSLLQRKKVWHWLRGRSAFAVSPAAAIGAAAADYCGASADDSSVLVVPNFCDSAAQQEILEAAEARGCRLRLLWRPVAAALAWLRQVQSVAPDRRPQLAEDDMVAFVYFGYEQIETTVLRLRLEEGMLVPARERPQPNHLVASPGLAGLINTAAALMRDEPSSVGLWNTLWTTRLLPEISGRMNATASLGARIDSSLTRSVNFAKFEKAWLKGIASEVCPAGKELVAFQRNLFGEAPRSDHLTTWIASAQSASFSAKPKYAVAFGPMAGALLEAQRNFATAVFEALPSVSRVWLEGSDTTPGLAAEGAALYAERIALQQPTYLDRLPKFELQIMRNGNPEWLDLLHTESWVRGGKTWFREGYGISLKIPAKQDRLPLAVFRDDFEHVRLLDARLQKATTQPESISLRTEIEPAQGNARIYVTPIAPEFAGKRILVDWVTVKLAAHPDTNLPLSKDDYIKSLPKAFPDHSPRESSDIRWDAACATFLNLPTSLRFRDIERLRNSLLTQFHGRPNVESRAVSSEGTVSRRPDVLEGIESLAVSKLDSRVFGDAALRLLGNISSKHPTVLLRLRLRIEPVAERSTIWACGHCLRHPDDIRAFFRSFISPDIGTPNEWLAAIERIVRYREGALVDIDSKLCESVVEKALETLSSRLSSSNVKATARNAAMVITYSLRRRQWDPRFITPDQTLGSQIISTLQETKEFLDRVRHPTRTQLRLKEQIPRMIDYVHGAGVGPPYVDEDD